jgi:genome maintenance exonuclease 1
LIYTPDKFPYKELKRETINGSRKYMTPDGHAVPSVTTILDATKSEESKKALHEWRKRVGPEKAQQITTEAAGRGTRMHKWLENYVKTGVTGEPGSNPYSIQSHQMAHSIISKGLSNCSEFWGTEVSLYFPEVYAGTTDLVGVHGGDEAIMDHKQTNKPKKREWIEDYFVQTAAYALAHNEVWGTKIRKGVIFMCSAANEYQEFIVEGADFDKYTDLWYTRLDKYYTQFL